MSFRAPDPWGEISAELSKSGRRPVIAVIAYVGKTAELVLSLRRGDVLACDASKEAVQAGSTDVAMLKRYRGQGVHVLSIPGLHAKLILGPRSAWVGSGNASRHSRDELLEASVKVTDPQSVAQIRKWVEELCTEDAVLSAADLVELARIPVRTSPPAPRKTRLPSALPRTVDRLWLVETEAGASQMSEKHAAANRSTVASAGRRALASSSLDWIEWTGPLAGVRKGDWMIDVRSGHPRRPALIVRTSKAASRHIIWLARVGTESRPTKAELLSVLKLSVPLDGESYLIPKNRQRAVLDLYRL